MHVRTKQSKLYIFFLRINIHLNMRCNSNALFNSFLLAKKKYILILNIKKTLIHLKKFISFFKYFFKNNNNIILQANATIIFAFFLKKINKQMHMKLISNLWYNGLFSNWRAIFKALVALFRRRKRKKKKKKSKKKT